MKTTIHQAILAHQEGRFEEAEQFYKTILESQPEHLDALNNLGALLLQNNRFEEAEEYCKKAIELKPDFAEAHNNLGFVLQKLNKYDEAIIIYKKVIALKPDFLQAHSNLGLILQKLNKHNEAIKKYKKVLELKPDYFEVHYNLGVALEKCNKIKDAIACYKKAIELNQNYVDAYNNLGGLLQYEGKLDEAEVCYKKVIELKPDHLRIYYNLAALLDGQNRKDEAEKYYQKAIQIHPNDKEALINKGQILFNKGEYERALRDFDTCNNKSSRAHALVCLYNLGRINDIYQRIEKNNQLDEKNLSVAAFSSFISHKEKKDTANKFCNKPINFIYYSNLSSHLENANYFITEVIEELKNVESTWEPYNRTTRKGYASNHNLFRNPLEKMNNLKTIILNEITLYQIKFKEELCSFIQKWPLKYELTSWQVILKQQGFQTSHIHPEAWLSGVIYLKTVPTLNKDEGAIEFSLNGYLYSDPKSPKVIYNPSLGDMVLFPSSLYHKTIPFTSDVDRIIVSFDLVPKNFDN